MTTTTMYDRLGELGVRRIIDRFVDRIFDDVMIGFFFRNADKQRIQTLEYQHAAEFLGGPVRYRGRPLDQAHAAHRIMGGQFGRRMQILREVLDEHEVPLDIAHAWIDHNESLRPLITGNVECNAP